jgi:hypothetical protein
MLEIVLARMTGKVVFSTSLPFPHAAGGAGPSRDAKVQNELGKRRS